MKNLQSHNLSLSRRISTIKKNDTFKAKSEVSFKSEFAELFRINNMMITETFNQKFETFKQ